MSVYLLDVNVLLALAWPNHLYHDRAHVWLTEQRQRRWATCPTTQSAFVRLSTNPKVVGQTVYPAQALSLLEANMDAPAHEFWRETLPVTKVLARLAEDLVGYRQITDAYLLGLAIHKKGVLATFDRSITHILPARSAFRKNLEIITPLKPA